MRLTIPAIAALVVVSGTLTETLQAQRTALEIVDEVDQLLRGESSRGEMFMEVTTEHWSRSIHMRIWSLGTEFALIRILEPRKEAGTATLKVDDQIWNYLPRVDRTIRIPPSLMGGAWMGSHFTNDDLVKESRLIQDYDIQIAFEGVRNGERVWEFLLTPKPEAAVVWGSIREEVRQRDLMPIWARYYDEDENSVRELRFTDFQMMGGRMVPATMTVTPTDKPDERTVVRYENLEFNIDLDEAFFSLRRLRSDRER